MSFRTQSKSEKERIETLNSLKILDTPSESNLDNIVSIASIACDVPTAVISLVDTDRQWFKAKVGLDVCETPRSVAFCHHAIEQDELFIVPDATQDKLFKNNPLVTDAPGIRFYAGVPLVVNNFKVGTLCVIDLKPRSLSESQKAILQKLAAQVIEIFRLRQEKLDREETARDYQELSGVLEDLNSLHYRDFETEEDLLREYLNVGARHLNVEYGIISEITGQKYEVKSCIAPNGEFSRGDIFQLEKTYCAEVIRTKKTVTYANIGEDPNLNQDSLYRTLGLEAYIGSPIQIDGHVIGTLNFSSTTAKTASFRPLEKNLVEILAEAIGNRIKLKRSQASIDKKSEVIRQQQLDNKILRESSELGLWKWNLETNKISYDERLFEMLGYTSADFEHSLSVWDELTHPDDKELSFGKMKDYLYGEANSFEVVYRVKHADGHWVWILSKGKVLQSDEQGNPLIFCGTHFDLSKLKEQEIASENLKQIANRVQKIAQIGGWKFELATQDLIWSDEVYRIHGLEIDSEVDVANAIDFYAPHEREKISTHMQEAVEKKIPWDGEFEFIDANGTKKWVRAFGEPVISEKGEVYALQGYFQDVTESVKRQKEVEKLRDLAEEANRAKSQFLANMSHELRTPLNAVIGYSELLMEDTTPEQAELEDDLKKIRNSGKHLLSLINQVLDLSKVEAGGKEASPEAFEVSQLSVDIEVLVASSVKQNNNNLEIDFSKMPSTIVTDYDMLKQILINLVSNAAKFTDSGDITVKGYVDSSSGADQFVFQVSDTGIGIAADRLTTIFKEFSQADETISKKYGGTGLGLSISRKFAQILNGSLEVESQVGRGSIFRLILPSNQAVVTPIELHSVPNDEAPSVLVIDDDVKAREISKRSLANLDIKILEASDGRQGVSMAKTLLPSIIILDISMPDFDGWQVLKELRSDPSTQDIPVIVVSMVDQSELGLSLGANVYFLKPIHRHTLLQAVEDHLEERAS